jgi:hypothetical protein
MAIQIETWASQADYERWLTTFPRSMKLSPEALFSMFETGSFDDDDTVWAWAQFWHSEHEQSFAQAEWTGCLSHNVDAQSIIDAWDRAESPTAYQTCVHDASNGYQLAA